MGPAGRGVGATRPRGSAFSFLHPNAGASPSHENW